MGAGPGAHRGAARRPRRRAPASAAPAGVHRLARHHRQHPRGDQDAGQRHQAGGPDAALLRARARRSPMASVGAYGIDAAAHRGALAAEAVTIAVLACGVDYPYPAGHADLFAAIAAQGMVVSEWPPGRHPARTRFLVRNRVIAALGCGTVIVEAGERSGALNTARHAANLGKPLMAVPGPVTSAQSAGCHRIIREWGASCVTRAADIIELLSPLSAPDALAPGGGPGRPARRDPTTGRRPTCNDLDP